MYCSLCSLWRRLLMKGAAGYLPESHQQAGSSRSGIALFARAIVPVISA
jgi:hypothetical protein